MLPESRMRVSRHTADHVNQDLRREFRANIECYINAGPEVIGMRLKELDAEWDIERTLETNAAIFSLAGLFLGRTVRKNSICFLPGWPHFSCSMPCRGGARRCRYSGAWGFARPRRSMPSGMP